MSLLNLNPGLFAGKPVKKEISYADGNTGEQVRADVYVRQPGLAQARRFIALYNRDSFGEEADAALAQTIAETIVDAKGKPLFAAEDVLRFKSDLVFALLAAIGEGNEPPRPAGTPPGEGNDPKPDSTKKRNSCAS